MHVTGLRIIIIRRVRASIYFCKGSFLASFIPFPWYVGYFPTTLIRARKNTIQSRTNILSTAHASRHYQFLSTLLVDAKSAFDEELCECMHPRVICMPERIVINAALLLIYA